MPTLLHLDSSVFPGERSASRSVTDTFRQAWQEQHPDGAVVYRDLAAARCRTSPPTPTRPGSPIRPSTRPGQSAALAARLELIEELEHADAVLLGAPMYNYSIPSTLKTWLDSVMLPGRTSGEHPRSKGTPIVVVASRGGSYRPVRRARTGSSCRTTCEGARREPRSGRGVHRSGADDGSEDAGHVGADPAVRALPRAGLRGRDRQGQGASGAPGVLIGPGRRASVSSRQLLRSPGSSRRPAVRSRRRRDMGGVEQLDTLRRDLHRPRPPVARYAWRTASPLRPGRPRSA